MIRTNRWAQGLREVTTLRNTKPIREIWKTKIYKKGTEGGGDYQLRLYSYTQQARAIYASNLATLPTRFTYQKPGFYF